MNSSQLNDNDLKWGIWGSSDTKIPNFNNSIPVNINETAELLIYVGAWTGLLDKEHKKLRKDWIKILPILKNLKHLWIQGSINQELFDTICKMNWLESLNLRGLISIKNVDEIKNLQNLKHLFIGSSSKLENIESISALNNLITLSIEGFKLIKDITPITKLVSLKGLHIKGDIWKKQYIDSINGIENLENLEYLSLDGTEVMHKDITPIKKLKNLKNLEIGYWWTEQDIKILYKALPLLKYGTIKEASESGEYDKYLKK